MADNDRLLEQFEELFEAERAHVSPSKRGFASMSQEQRRAVAVMGGKAAHEMGKAHTWTREEAQKAGRKGGLGKNYPGIPDLHARQR